MDESVLNGIFWNHLVYPELASDEAEDPAILLAWVQDRLPRGRWPEHVACLAVEGLDRSGSSERRETVQRVRRAIVETLVAPEYFLLGFAHTNALYFGGHATDGRPAFLDRLAAVIRRLAAEEALSTTFGVAFLPDPSLAGLQWAAQHAVVAQRRKVRTGANRVYVFDPTEPATSLDMAAGWDLARKMHRVMKSGEPGGTEAALVEITDALFRSAYLPLNHLRPVLQCQVLSMAQAATDAMADPDRVATGTESFLNDIATAYDYDRLRGILRDATRVFAGLIHERCLGHAHQMAAAADDDISARLAEPDLGLAAVAARIGVSPAHLSRTYKKVRGFGLTQAINRARVESAQRRLLDPRVRVTEAALDAGFSSLQHFGRVFKALTGSTPTAWRARIAASGAKFALPAGERSP